MSRRRTALAAVLSLLPLGQTLLLGSTTALATARVVLSTQAAVAQSVEVFIKRGYAKFKKGDYEEAIADYSKEIETNPEDDYAYYNRGLDKWNLKDYQGVIANVSKAIEIDQKMSMPTKTVVLPRN